MASSSIHGAFEELARDKRFDDLPIAFHIDAHREHAAHEIVVGARRAPRLIDGLTEFARAHGLRCHSAGAQVVMVLARTPSQ